MKFIKPAIFGAAAAVLTFLSTYWPGTLGILLLVGSLPMWLLFIVFAIHAVKPE